MTNSQPQDSPRVLLPGVAVLLFIAGPIMIVLGALLDSVSPAATVVFWTGIAALMSALILEGVRSIAQQQLDKLRAERLNE